MRVFLVRHAEAEPGHDMPDHARRLTRDGLRAARALGAWLAARQFPPDVLRCSSATRAVETAHQVGRALEVSAENGGSDELYLASASDLLAILRRSSSTGSRTGSSAGSRAEKVLALVGHNPGMAQLALRLAQTGEPSSLRRLASSFPPASCVEIAFDEPLDTRLATGEGELVAYWTPDSD